MDKKVLLRENAWGVPPAPYPVACPVGREVGRGGMRGGTPVMILAEGEGGEG